MKTAPKSLRLHIALFGRTNVGKSSFLNLITGQDVSIVSEQPGTTTDVVEKTMELLPIGPVVFIDTGYLFDETYRFVDELAERLKLNLHVFRAQTSPAWQEARYGKRWENGVEGIDAYNYDNKVEPMERALRDLKVGTWFAGLRRNQTVGRANAPFLAWSGDRWKVHPIADWTDRDVYQYLTDNDLPYHPLWKEGYVSIGDVHTTRSLNDVDNVEKTRFFGLKRECGLHEIDLSGL